MIDTDGYRPNVGIIIVGQQTKVFWARRVKERAWQFPQGGIKKHESPQQALYRELYEEVGLRPQDVTVLGHTKDWLRYQVPSHLCDSSNSYFIGQKQRWFLLRLEVDDQHIHIDRSQRPEFDRWRWVDYWYPKKHIVEFKRQVYSHALDEMSELLDF